MPARLSPSAILGGGAKVEIQPNGSIHILAAGGQPVETQEDRFRITHGPIEMVGLSDVATSDAGEGRFWYDAATNRWMYSENGGAAAPAFGGSVTLIHSDISDWDSAVDARISNVVAGAPAALDTLKELADAINDDANFAATVTTSLAGKFSKSGDTLTGTAGAGFHGFIPQSANPAAPASGFRLFANAAGKLTLIRPDGFTRTFDFGTITGNRTISFPDADITVIGATGAVTANRLARITGAGVLGDSLLRDDGTNVSLVSGQLLMPNGTAAAPAYSFSGATNYGIWRNSTQLVFSFNGINKHFFDSNADTYLADNTARLIFGAAFDVQLQRDGGADILALRRSTNAQIFRLYNTYTDANNYERASFDWTTNEFFIRTQNLGTGTARALKLISGSSLFLGANGNSRWLLDTSGNFIAVTDNAFDIGASGASRPRNIFSGGNIVAGGNFQTIASGVFTFTGRGFLGANADGVFMLANNAGSSFSRLQFGGTTAGFPALKRSGAAIDARLADDSDYSQFRCASLGVNNSAAATTPVNVVKKIQVFDAAGVSLGYVPVYDAIN